jgi:hypothetical protein
MNINLQSGFQHLINNETSSSSWSKMKSCRHMGDLLLIGSLLFQWQLIHEHMMCIAVGIVIGAIIDSRTESDSRIANCFKVDHGFLG